MSAGVWEWAIGSDGDCGLMESVCPVQRGHASSVPPTVVVLERRPQCGWLITDDDRCSHPAETGWTPIPPPIWFGCKDWWFQTQNKRVWNIYCSQNWGLWGEQFWNALREQGRSPVWFLLWLRAGAEVRVPAHGPGPHIVWIFHRHQRREHPGFLTSLPRCGWVGKREGQA